ncbi:vacuolar protein sorting-associated protein 45 [Pancytospora epiphaga]|nr:vacuolar protein sorting-associated protein 45 [Pancytospora epiphaga]
MDLLFKKQTDFILSRGKGIKACLFDEETKQSIGNIIPYSKFQDNDFFYFDFLGNRNRIPISDISCVVIIRSDSLKILIDELTTPCYKSYVVLFTNQIDPFILEILANSDVKCLITEIHEIYLDLYRESTNLYTVRSSRYKRVLDGLYSLIMTKEIIPNILYDLEIEEKKPGENSLMSLGRELEMRAKQYNFKRLGTVVLLKRGFDLITPLLFDWHYQALMYEYLDCKNGVVKLNGREYSISDPFFEKNKFNNIHTVGDNIRDLIKELERNKVKISNYEFEDIEEKAAHSLMVETHLTIYNKILELCMKNKKQSETEYYTVKGESNNNIENNLKETDEKVGLKFALLNFIKKVNLNDWEEESKKCLKQRQALQYFREKYCPRDYPYKPTFRQGVDIKLGYEPPLKKMAKHIILNKLKGNSLNRIGEENGGLQGPIIFYVEGGVTMCEYREVSSLSEELKSEIIIVSDKIINYNNIIEEINKVTVTK